MRQKPGGFGEILKMRRENPGVPVHLLVKQKMQQRAVGILDTNKPGVENFTRSMARLNRKGEIQAIIDSGEQIIVENCDELLEYIACILGKDIGHVNLHGYHTDKRFEEAELTHIFVFFAISLGFSSPEIGHGRIDPFIKKGISRPKILELTRKHIVSNKPSILRLGKQMGLEFDLIQNTQEGLKLAISGESSIPNNAITIKKGSSMENTLDNIYQVLGKKKIEAIFEEGKTQDPIRQWTDDQKATMGKLCYIMNQIYIQRGDMGKIADALASKTGMKRSTISSTYMTSKVAGLKIVIES